MLNQVFTTPDPVTPDPVLNFVLCCVPCQVLFSYSSKQVSISAEFCIRNILLALSHFSNQTVVFNFLQNILWSDIIQKSTYSYVVDQYEAIFPHQLLSLQLQVDLWQWLGLHSRLGGLLGGRLCLEDWGKRNCGGVFTRIVAHLTHYRGLGVCIGAELACPL